MASTILSQIDSKLLHSVGVMVIVFLFKKKQEACGDFDLSSSLTSFFFVVFFFILQQHLIL